MSTGDRAVGEQHFRRLVADAVAVDTQAARLKGAVKHPHYWHW